MDGSAGYGFLREINSLLLDVSRGYFYLIHFAVLRSVNASSVFPLSESAYVSK